MDDDAASAIHVLGRVLGGLSEHRYFRSEGKDPLASVAGSWSLTEGEASGR